MNFLCRRFTRQNQLISRYGGRKSCYSTAYQFQDQQIIECSEWLHPHSLPQWFQTCFVNSHPILTIFRFSWSLSLTDHGVFVVLFQNNYKIESQNRPLNEIRFSGRSQISWTVDLIASLKFWNSHTTNLERRQKIQGKDFDKFGSDVYKIAFLEQTFWLFSDLKTGF